MASQSSSSAEPSRDAEQRVKLLDDDETLTEEFVTCLRHIFAKYCTPAPPGRDSADPTTTTTLLLEPPEDAVFDDSGLDAWASATNGAPLTEEEKGQLEMLDVDEDGRLTFDGFVQLYQLQTENDAEETWRDLAKHGFDTRLRLRRGAA